MSRHEPMFNVQSSVLALLAAMVAVHLVRMGLSQDWVTAADPSGSSDPAGLQPELGTAIDYDQAGRTDILLHDVYGSRANWQVLVT